MVDGPVLAHKVGALIASLAALGCGARCRMAFRAIDHRVSIYSAQKV